MTDRLQRIARRNRLDDAVKRHDSSTAVAYEQLAREKKCRMYADVLHRWNFTAAEMTMAESEDWGLARQLVQREHPGERVNLPRPISRAVIVRMMTEMEGKESASTNAARQDYPSADGRGAAGIGEQSSPADSTEAGDGSPAHP